MVTVQFQHRKSEIEIESVINRSKLHQIAMDHFSCSEDAILKLYDQISGNWEEITSKNGELTLREGTKLKLKSTIPVSTE